MVGNRDPQDDCQARFSAPYALSLVLAGLDPETVPLPSAWLTDRHVRGWLPRVRIEGHSDFGRRKARVTATFRNGTKIEADQPLRNLQKSEVLDRLDRVALSHLGAGGNRLVEIVTGLNRQEDLSELGALLRSDGRQNCIV